MLISILLTLTANRDAVLPAHLGRAHYAETLKRIGQFDARLAEAIHVGDGPKPITCSGLWGATSSRDPSLRDTVTVHAGARYTVRITGLTGPVSRMLLATFVHEPPPVWALHNGIFSVDGVCCNAQRDPWSGATTYEELAAAQLLQGAPKGHPPPRQVTLEFASPTAFKSAGLTVPVPMPNLVFGSLVERWNAFSPVTLSPEMRRFGEEMVALSRYRLESRVVEQKNNALRIGGVGQATYVAVAADRYWLAVLQMLADFALYSGVG
ncbi:MAG: CRISPR-associated protein Cas6, partial [Chloroflexi bacterium]